MKTNTNSTEYKTGYIDIPIDMLVKANWNYKLNDDELHNKLLENFKRNGQIENIIVRQLDTGFFEIINGNHRLDVMKELKMEKAHCFNFGKISLPQAQRIAIETNETRFKNDEYALGQLFKEINEEYDMNDILKTVPFSEDYIKSLMDWSDIDISSFFEQRDNGESEAEEEEKPKVLICPHCGKNVYEE